MKKEAATKTKTKTIRVKNRRKKRVGRLTTVLLLPKAKAPIQMRSFGRVLVPRGTLTKAEFQSLLTLCP